MLRATIVSILLALIPGAAAAQLVTYQFTAPDFTTISSGTRFSTSDSISGTLTINCDAIGGTSSCALLPLADYTSAMTSFSFTATGSPDLTITSADSNLGRNFTFQTNERGDMVSTYNISFETSNGVGGGLRMDLRETFAAVNAAPGSPNGEGIASSPAGAWFRPIGAGSCVGVDACFQGPTIAGISSCVGDESCFQGPNEVGDNTCVGPQVCFQGGGTPPTVFGSDSCHGTFACFQNSGDIGNNSCNGDSSCFQNLGDIGDNSCNGFEACLQNTAAIGDCQNNTVFVPACGPIVEVGDLNIIDDPGNPSDGLAYLEMTFSVGLTQAAAVTNAQATYPSARLATPAEWDDLFAAAGINYNGSFTASDAFSTGSSVVFLSSGANYDGGALALKLGPTSGLQVDLWSDPDGSTNIATTRDVNQLGPSDVVLLQQTIVPPGATTGWLLVIPGPSIGVPVPMLPTSGFMILGLALLVTSAVALKRHRA